MLTSVRASCSVAQNPNFAAGSFVEHRATEITPTRGTAAIRVNKPTSTKLPHRISTVPTKGAMACGQGIPIFRNRPTPSASGTRNF